MIHAHITAWLLGIILFIVAVSMKNGNEKTQKIVHMILRLFYILILVSGLVILFSGISINGEYIGKAVLGFLVIGMMEMILTRGRKGKSTGLFWVLFIIILILTISLGLRLPLGMDFM